MRKRRKKLLWQLFSSYIIIILIVLITVGLYASRSLKQFHSLNTAKGLKARAHFADRLIEEKMKEGEDVVTLCKELGQEISTRITMILPSGQVVCDSDKDPSLMDNHAGRPEIKKALGGSVGVSTRHSKTLNKDMMYVAIPTTEDGRITGVVRTSTPVVALTQTLRGMYLKILLGGILIALIAALVSLTIARRISKPLEEMRRGAEHFAEGDFDYRLEVKNSEELEVLSNAMNQMAARLNERITKLHDLERIRRDFVANVSHELKTPITSIKGFVETLKDGAIADPENAKRFLDIVGKHTDRLNAIIEDLLSLSRIEQETEKEEKVELEPGNVKDVLNAALLICRSKASEKKIDIKLICEENLTAMMNALLLEQAVVNLIDNAVKYSNPDSVVRVEAMRKDDAVIINTIDSGCGIPREDLPRIFERFYRVDKARSRSMGGTGLGLSIVKHIVILHRGFVTVESAEGKGSTFTIHIPSSI